uniref:Signal peptide, CUB and EGF-like domain-containing protein 3 n=1 Tax=Crassostrea virginica TaxID=6565 RepID=A0A8B8D6I6_CRAVI|nr:signal peptide, CUB and EGF-like domain-containing protein 3 [Crassostrea virginica]
MDRYHCHSLTSACPRFCNLSCNRNQKCVLTDSNLAVCIATECGPFNETIEGKTNEKGTHFGTTYVIPCNTGFFGYQEFVCATNGKWESTHGDCQCWYGTYLNENGTECIECSAGKYLPSVGQIGNESCIDCPAGRYSQSPGFKICKECPIGYYQSKVGQTECFACEAGTYISSRGAESCKKCLPGTYSGSHADSCRPCRPGSYNYKYGAPSCTLCPIRSYQDKYGSTLCKLCLTANVTGSATC